MRAAIYCRVSTSDQKTEMQARDLRAYLEAKQIPLVKEYTDSGVSGTKRTRPALDELMRDARKGLFDIVIVWRFDRFARSASHLVQALEEFNSLNIQFVSLNEGIDTSTPMGKAMFTIIGAMAQLERDIIRERINAGLANARAKGKQLGRKRASNIDEVKKLRGEGYSLARIASTLHVSIGSVRTALHAST